MSQYDTVREQIILMAFEEELEKIAAGWFTPIKKGLKSAGHHIISKAAPTGSGAATAGIRGLRKGVKQGKRGYWKAGKKASFKTRARVFGANAMNFAARNPGTAAAGVGLGAVGAGAVGAKVLS